MLKVIFLLLFIQDHSLKCRAFVVSNIKTPCGFVGDIHLQLLLVLIVLKLSPMASQNVTNPLDNRQILEFGRKEDHVGIFIIFHGGWVDDFGS